MFVTRCLCSLRLHTFVQVDEIYTQPQLPRRGHIFGIYDTQENGYTPGAPTFFFFRDRGGPTEGGGGRAGGPSVPS